MRPVLLSGVFVVLAFPGCTPFGSADAASSSGTPTALIDGGTVVAPDSGPPDSGTPGVSSLDAGAFCEGYDVCDTFDDSVRRAGGPLLVAPWDKGYGTMPNEELKIWPEGGLRVVLAGGKGMDGRLEADLVLVGRLEMEVAFTVTTGGDQFPFIFGAECPDSTRTSVAISTNTVSATVSLGGAANPPVVRRNFASFGSVVDVKIVGDGQMLSLTVNGTTEPLGTITHAKPWEGVCTVWLGAYQANPVLAPVDITFQRIRATH